MIRIFLSTAIVNDGVSVENRLKEYEECFNIVKSFGYDFSIVETVLEQSDFLESYSDNVIYTNVNGVYNNRGTNYTNAFKKLMNISDFNDDDIIIHVTGRYPLVDDSFFKECEKMNIEDIGCFKKDKVDQFYLFLYAMRYKELKDLLNSIDVNIMERNMINLERIFSDRLFNSKIKMLSRLGIKGRQSNATTNPLYGKNIF